MKHYVVAALSMLAISLLGGIQLPAKAQAIGSDEFSTAAGSFNNMSVFLIHRKSPPKAQDIAKSENFLTLSEALAQKKLVINETGNVNQLTMQNFGDRPVFIQGGDIIKGGRQDRALQSDLILPPKSKLTEVSVFCVEQGRWSQRGTESDKAFGSSLEALPSPALKMSAMVTKNQSAVWSGVQELQGAVAGTLGTSAAAPASPTSLQLTLENKKMRDAAQQYVNKLDKIVDGKDDVVGYAVAINGKVTSADVYGSPALFKKMWHKQLSAAATEAFVKQGEGKASPTDASAQVAKLKTRDSDSKSHIEKAGLANVEVEESSKSVLLKTTDAKGNLYHRSYMNKSAL
jgi:hypothetical protein